jgi:hypothetical protein
MQYNKALRFQGNLRMQQIPTRILQVFKMKVPRMLRIRELSAAGQLTISTFTYLIRGGARLIRAKRMMPNT